MVKSILKIADMRAIARRRVSDGKIILTANGVTVKASLRDWNLLGLNAPVEEVVA